jgi:hypothetical protein
LYIDTLKINKPPLLPLDDNEEYVASCFVEEDDNFPGYVKLSLAEKKTDDVLYYCRRMNHDKHYLLNSSIMDSFSDALAISLKMFDRFSPPCQNREIGYKRVCRFWPLVVMNAVHMIILSSIPYNVFCLDGTSRSVYFPVLAWR